MKSVKNNSPAAAAGIKQNDIIVKVAINGTIAEMEKYFPLPEDKSIRVITVTVLRKSDENTISFSDIDVFVPSYVEHFLFP